MSNIQKLVKIQDIFINEELLDESTPRTKYCSIRGRAMAGSIFPTMTTVKVEGSLKQLLKYAQALKGSTFFKSPILIGCKEKPTILFWNVENENQ